MVPNIKCSWQCSSVRWDSLQATTKYMLDMFYYLYMMVRTLAWFCSAPAETWQTVTLTCVDFSSVSLLYTVECGWWPLSDLKLCTYPSLSKICGVAYLVNRSIFSASCFRCSSICLSFLFWARPQKTILPFTSELLSVSTAYVKTQWQEWPNATVNCRFR